MPPQAVFGRPGVTFPSGNYARLRPVDTGTVAFESTYHTALVNDFKQSVPFQCRRWDAANKRWLIDPSYAPICADLAEQYLGVRPAVPQVIMPTQAPIEQRLVRLDYLGRCKERVPGEDPTASGWADGKWSLVFSEMVLRTWFEPGIVEETEAPAQQGKPSTLYALLNVKPSATVDELKTAYRRLARATHPDVNKEPDAGERFIALKDANDVLIDDQKRRRYDAGLAFEAASVARDPYVTHYDTRLFSASLRCGWLLVEGRQQFGGFLVSRILGWEDITREDGRVMVTSWRAGDKHFTTDWVEP